MSETTYENECEVTIEGIGKGILLNNPSSMFDPQPGGLSKKHPTPEEDAAKKCYWTEDKKHLAFPGDNIWRGMINASTGAKLPSNKKMSLGPLVAGNTEIFPSMISFGTKKYEIDTRRAVVQRQGIPRSRPKLPTWSLTFRVGWDSGYLGKEFHETILPQLLDRLGHQIGIGDFRPEKKGPFGKFKVVKIKKI
jgi:hypothetical protein